MALCDLKFKKLYRTRQEDYVNLMLAPALKESVSYDRGTGFFTLDSLAELADGLIPFIRNGGNIRIVTSVELKDSDVVAIQSGLMIQDDTIIARLREKIMEYVTNEDALVNLDLITNLITTGQLQIKVAYMPDGIYHEKIGILTDHEGNALYFSGSANATVSGLKKNWESVVVFASWWGDDELIDDQKQYFEELWSDKLDDIEILDLPEAEKQLLIQKYKVSKDVESAIGRKTSPVVNNSGKKTMYPYQKKAVDQFADNMYCHFLEMATGTGKTYTAVQTIKRVHHDCGKVSAVILVPQIDLQVQWAKALTDEDIGLDVLT